MIRYVQGDATQLFSRTCPAVICHCVNDAGKWGAGFTRSLAKWPAVERDYRGRVHVLGDAWFTPVSRVGELPLWVASIVGQHGTIGMGEPQPVRYASLFEGLCRAGDFAKFNGADVHMPRLGAGLARGHWPTIEGLIMRAMPDLSVTVWEL